MADAGAMIAAGELSGAWPTALRFADVHTVDGLKVPGRGIVASYAEHPEVCLSVVGDRYRATMPEEWRNLVRAAAAAGAEPTGAFSLRDGTRVLATFQVGTANGLRTQLLIADAFDGSMGLICGTTSIRVVCANTLSAALGRDGADMATLRHTASLETQINILAANIGEAIKSGEAVRARYARAEEQALSLEQARAVFDALFPDAPEDADKAWKTRAANVRRDAEMAGALSVNAAGPTLATLWNAATFLVDRNADGTARPTRGGDALDSLLFGARAERIAQITTIVESALEGGAIEPKTSEEGGDPQK